MLLRRVSALPSLSGRPGRTDQEPASFAIRTAIGSSLWSGHPVTQTALRAPISLSDPSLTTRQSSRDVAWVESASRSSVGVFCVLVVRIAGLVGVVSPTVVVLRLVRLLDVARLIGVVCLPVGAIRDVPVVGVAGLSAV